jgi:hypothetical protein
VFQFRSRQPLLLVFSLFVLASLACGSYSRDSEEIVRTATAPATLVPATPVPVTYLGDQVERDGYSLAALAVENPATRPGIFYEPQPGKKLIAVEFIAGNVAGEQFDSNVLYATLVDTDGFLYGAENTVVEGQIEMLEVNPGERVQGWAAFLVPESAQAATFKYDINGVELAVGLLPRP